MALRDLPSLLGQSLGTSDWFAMSQERINLFAAATLDFQAIHIDPEQAAKTPFGGTIAHGLLTLSLVPHLLYPLLTPHLPAESTSVNYGIDKLRFIQPVRNDDQIRLQVTVNGSEAKDPGRVLLRLGVTVEIAGADKPALISESLVMIMAAD